MRASRLAPWLVLAVVTATVVGVTTASGGGDRTAAERARLAGVEQAKAEVMKYMKLPKFVPPGPKLDGKKIAAGKTIMLIPFSTQIPYNAAFDQATKQYAEAVGFKVIDYPTAGLPDQWNRGIQLAISKKVAAIDFTAGLDVRAITPQIQRAKAAGIAVLDSTFADPAVATPSFLSGGVPLGYYQSGRLEANYAIWKTNGKGNFLEINTPGLVPSIQHGVSAGQHDAIKENCPDCKLTKIDVPIPQWATNTTPQVLAALKKDPGINYILPHYDSQSEFVIPALNTLGKAGKVGIASFNGTPAILELVRSGKVNMDVGEDVAWAGAATVDSILRVLGKVNPASGTIDEHIPLRVFDSSNIKELGTGKIGYGTGYGGAHDAYLKLWGVK
jgi:ribose transport system substrate-binding protein